MRGGKSEKQMKRERERGGGGRGEFTNKQALIETESNILRW